MTSFRILGYDPDDHDDPVPTSVDQYWSREARSWVTFLLDENGYDMDTAYDGTRADAACSKAAFQRRIDAAKENKS